MIMAWFKKKTFQSDLVKVRKELKLISKDYEKTSGYSMSTISIEAKIKDIEKNILPLSKSLIAIGKQTSSLLKSVTTSFGKIINDPTFNEKLKGPKLTLRQLTAYRNVLQGNKQGLEGVQKKIKTEKTDLQGAYAALEKIEKNLNELNSKMNKAKKGDYRMHKLLPHADELLTKLSRKLYP